VPAGRPAWVLPVTVGVIALALGGLVTLLATR
jgi:hypothetical protein